MTPSPPRHEASRSVNPPYPQADNKEYEFIKPPVPDPREYKSTDLSTDREAYQFICPPLS